VLATCGKHALVHIFDKFSVHLLKLKIPCVMVVALCIILLSVEASFPFILVYIIQHSLATANKGELY
jgi:hypothetical protein